MTDFIGHDNGCAGSRTKGGPGSRAPSDLLARLLPIWAGLALAGAPPEARACGGTFCDAGPQSMPVDQTGETILFVMGGNYVEAHIRIEYDPSTQAASFAWLVPVPMVPEFAVSSEQLFLNVLGATVPTYGSNPTFDTCPDGGTTGAFILAPDGGGFSGECDLWSQDCPAGEKCMPWANDGGNSWNATKCSPIADAPGKPGDPCQVEISGVSGVDDCEAGSMCFSVNPATLTGVCAALCTGSETNPSCPNGGTCEILHDGVLPLCQVACDPLASACPQGQACLQNGAGDYACTPVHFQGTVGAFDVAVIGGNDVDDVMQWLGANGYQQDPAAMPVLAEYLAEGYMFAAFKLANGAGSDTIHPVALRFPGSDEACIPIRLTRIAAQNDMKIRAFFLGDARTAPTNWRHVVPNPVRLDWSTRAANYDGAVTLAVDELPANGRAFVTEYAGPSDVVALDGLWSSAWDPAPFVAAAPTAVVDLLAAQGLMGCDGGTCTYAHPLLHGLLESFLPPPAGVAPDAFYGCLSCFAGQIDPGAWDGPAFAAAMDERIVAPGLRAREILQSWPYLTRLFTTLSPFEMTIDPLFHENFDLPPLQNITPTATRRALCNGDAVWILPDGREVYLPAGATWPAFAGDMAWSERMEMVPLAGAPLIEAERTQEIDAALREHNCGFDWPSPEACGGAGGGSSGGSGGGGTTTTGDPGAADDAEPLQLRGCGCRSAGGGSPWWWAASLLLTARRRRRR